jgi:CheY-like chemotaxis protein
MLTVATRRAVAGRTRGCRRRTPPERRRGSTRARLRTVRPGAATVLIVEDLFDMRDTVAEILEGEGHAVWQAKSADEALQVVDDRGAPDVLIVDVVMPGMPIRQLIEGIKGDARWSRTCIIVMTAAPEAYIPSALRAFPLLSKPFHIPQLLKLVASAAAAQGTTLGDTT